MTPARFVAIKVIMMPRDTNPHGTIFGGVLMSYIDQAGVVGARHEIARLGIPVPTLVTVAIDKVEFHKPVYVGDTVTFYTELCRIGRTSITMHVTVEAERDGTPATLTQADITYVAIRTDGNRRTPMAIRP